MISEQIWGAFDTWGFDQRQYAANTRTLYVRRCKAAERWLNVSLYRATTADLQAWHVSLPPTPSSRNMGRQALAAFYDFLIDRTTRTTNPARLLPSFRYPETVPKALDVEDAQRVVAQPSEPEWIFATSLLFHTALRATEARTLTWDRIVGGEWVLVTVKGGRQRALPLHPHTARAASDWRTRCPDPRWVFPSPVKPDAPLSDSAFRQRIKNIAADAGVDMTPHVARHSCGTRLVEQGVDLMLVKELFGHSSLATTQRYLRARPERLATSVGGLDFVAA